MVRVVDTGCRQSRLGEREEERKGWRWKEGRGREGGREGGRENGGGREGEGGGREGGGRGEGGKPDIECLALREDGSAPIQTN